MDFVFASVAAAAAAAADIAAQWLLLLLTAAQLYLFRCKLPIINVSIHS